MTKPKSLHATVKTVSKTEIQLTAEPARHCDRTNFPPLIAPIAMRASNPKYKNKKCLKFQMQTSNERSHMEYRMVICVHGALCCSSSSESCSCFSALFHCFMIPS